LARNPRFDSARDELFANINRCNVLRATDEQKQEWMDDTVEYLAERYTDLSQQQLDELRSIGMRFCQPVIPHGKEHTALSMPEPEENESESESESDALAGSA
jgi:hypothetical protein